MKNELRVSKRLATLHSKNPLLSKTVVNICSKFICMLGIGACSENIDTIVNADFSTTLPKI